MKTVMETVFGSHLYGLNTPTSDKDYKGIFLPHPRDILLGKAPKTIDTSTGDKSSKNTVDDVDRQLYSLTKFISLACDGDTVALDMLHASDDKLIANSEIWQYIRANRWRFYTTELTGLFGYVRKQAAKYGVKGSRLAALREVVDVLNDTQNEMVVKTPLCNTTHRVKVGEVSHTFPTNEFCRFVTDTTMKSGCQDFYEVLGRKFQSTITVAEMKKSVYKLWDEYGERARQAEANNGIDWKALSHALRGGMQLIQIYKDGDIVYPLPDSAFLKLVKAGGVPFATVQEKLEEVMGEVERLAAISTYPKEVDREFWNDFIERVYSDHVVGYYK
ncbi:nucleotidyltransferase [Citrobacter phage Margaery]|uniref:Nucleotidyltransferase n=3 Tax=root TaxID=1 RepID=A0A0M4R245_9CAUD|nr:nucleotidyltransferase [Citrobacter phage Margaery]ALF01821.1 nucleotidyltransferase [Citrobacter phage Margaery]AYJ72992.1 NrdC [Citrobacter phage Maroon]